jgi:hypothetical protein
MISNVGPIASTPPMKVTTLNGFLHITFISLELPLVGIQCQTLL